MHPQNWLIRFKPNGKGRWVDLSSHTTECRASAVWHGWMLIVPHGHSAWIIEERQTEMGRPATTPFNPFGFPEDDGRDPKAILADLELRGITWEIDGDNLRKTAGDLTEKDRGDVKACKLEIMRILRHRLWQAVDITPWNGAEALHFLEKARASFKGLWDDLQAQPIGLTKQSAAFAILSDGLAMLAEGVRDQDLDKVRDKTLYLEWLCNRVRTAYREVT